MKTLKDIITLTEKTNHTAHISASNSKTGIPSFNLLAGCGTYDGYRPHTFDNAPQIAGTCTHNCAGCYAKKMTRYTGVYFNYYENTLLIRRNLPSFKHQMYAYFTNYKRDVFRIHDSGDFDTFGYFVAWCEIARAFPRVQFYTYTKRTDLLRKYLEEGRAIPSNLTINLSFWAGVCEDMIEGFPRFEYDDGTRAEVSRLPHCPAVSKDGKRTGVTCSQCKRCAYAKAGNMWAVYPH